MCSFSHSMIAEFDLLLLLWLLSLLRAVLKRSFSESATRFAHLFIAELMQLNCLWEIFQWVKRIFQSIENIIPKPLLIYPNLRKVPSIHRVFIANRILFSHDSRQFRFFIVSFVMEPHCCLNSRRLCTFSRKINARESWLYWFFLISSSKSQESCNFIQNRPIEIRGHQILIINSTVNGICNVLPFKLQSKITSDSVMSLVIHRE